MAVAGTGYASFGIATLLSQRDYVTAVEAIHK